MIPNILAERYASKEMQNIWSASGRILLERDFWIAVMKAQRDLGLAIEDRVIQDYERVKHQIDLISIARREQVTRHDVKARIDEFCELAGHQQIHQGLTSRDLTENIEQLQVLQSLELIRDRTVAALAAFRRNALRWQHLLITARTHNVAAQPTTLGKRIAMFGEELLVAFDSVRQLLDDYPLRGIKGAVGTQLDQLSLFGHDASKVSQLESRIADHLGFTRQWVNVGQVYPRSLDLRFVNLLVELASGPASFAKTLRLMAGQELASEGFSKGQTGSSAMPHKMNSRSCERINGLHTILKGYQTMAAGLAGDQWNEGDVSCSVVRRVMLPDACFALDGLFETLLTVLDQMEVFDAVIEQENQRCLPFLLTTTALMASVTAGVGRETAHAAIKEHAIATLEDLRTGKITANDLFARLANDRRLKLSGQELDRIRDQTQLLMGAAVEQVDNFARRVDKIVLEYPQAARYRPNSIL
jgi:adenylosuccinate lyase